MLSRNCDFTDPERAEIIGLMGGLVAGKSTLAKVTIGLEKPSQGEIWMTSPTQSKDLALRILLVFRDSLSFGPIRTLQSSRS